MCDAALDRDARERAAFVAAACAGDGTLRQEVEALLAHAQTAEGFLAVSMGEVAARVLADEHRASLVGRQIGPCTILSLLGAGGMGEVYRARDTRLGREVAVKVVPEAFVSDPERLARFEREARVLATLNHPHIGAIYGVEEADPSAGSGQAAVRALVLELVEGATLAERLAAGRLPMQDALTVARQIADALEAAHEKGIVHRDLKPANIKLTPNGVVKVLDFGLAKAAAGDGSAPDISQSPVMTIDRTREGVILGTAAYMSPEQARGKPVDKRTDIWAFGCVLYEMLTGRQALAGETVSDTIAAILEREPDWTALPDTTPATVRRLLLRCLQKDPKQRLRDIGDVRLELDDVLAPGLHLPAVGSSVPLHDASPGAAHTAAVRATVVGTRRARLIAAAGATALVAALAVGGVIYLRRGPADTGAYRSSILLPAGVSFPPASVPSQRFTLSPDGRRLAFIAGEGGDVGRLWVQALDGLTPRPLPGTEDARFAFWSPDSRFIGFFAERKVKTIDAAGGPPLTLADAAPAPGGAWSPDGTILFASFGPGNPLRRVSASGGPSSPVTTLDADNGETQHWFPFFLPDGRHFLYLAVGSKSAGPNSPNGIYVATLGSNERKLLVPGGSNAMYAAGHLLFLREQTLMAQPFDVQRLEFTGAAVPIAEDVAIGGAAGMLGGFAVSQNGVLAYQVGPSEVGGSGAGTPTRLTWFDRSGKEIGVFGDQAGHGDLELSPGGTRVAVSLFDLAQRTRDIWHFDIERGLRTRFTFDAADELATVWSPDGSRIVFNAFRAGRFDLYQKASSGIGAEELLLGDSLNKFPLDWSPDGRFVLFSTTSTPGTQADLWVLPLFGDRRPFPFLQTPVNELRGRFSPDGRWIAYVSNESGRNDVYVAPFAGGAGKWQISASGGNFPRWRRDGKEIFYLAPDNTLMSVEVNGARSALEAGTVRPLFQARVSMQTRWMYDVSPDGQRFLVNAIAQETSSMPLTLLVNWTALLKQ